MSTIELEFRSEIDLKDYEEFQTQLSAKFKLISHTKRISFMAFGEGIDVRVRITNGDSEVVIKKGEWNAGNRVEISQPIDKSQFIGFTKIFSAAIAKCHIAERENYNYQTIDDIIISLVRSKKTAYLEFEKMSDPSTEVQNTELILNLMKELKLEPMTKAQFDDMCKRQDESDDWKFDFNNLEHFRILEEMLINHLE